MEQHAIHTNTAQEPVISVSGLSKSFGKTVVLDDFNLILQRGESKVVLGRSGSGKSVLIKCIIGLLKPDAGVINVFGRNILSLDKDALDQIRVRIGFLFQSNALYDSMTVRENLEFPMRRHAVALTPEEADHRVMEALDNVGLQHTVDMMPAELSGGMKKRIALARTLILRPDIILYDEPTSGLDPVTAREITGLIKRIQEKYRTSSVIISHDMKCIQTTADSVIVLMHGKRYHEDRYEALTHATDPLVKQFFE